MVNVGSIDIYHKNSGSEDVIEKFEQIGTLKDKSDNVAIVGASPWLNEGNYALGRALGVDERLKCLCTVANIGF